MILTDRDSYRGRISRENRFITDSNIKNSYNFVAFNAKGQTTASDQFSVLHITKKWSFLYYLFLEVNCAAHDKCSTGCTCSRHLVSHL